MPADPDLAPAQARARAFRELQGRQLAPQASHRCKEEWRLALAARLAVLQAKQRSEELPQLQEEPLLRVAPQPAVVGVTRYRAPAAMLLVPLQRSQGEAPHP